MQFRVQDAAQIQETERYDLITTFDAIHDQAHPDIVLHNIYNALRTDGGLYLMQDIRASTEVSGNLDNPLAPLLILNPTLLRRLITTTIALDRNPQSFINLIRNACETVESGKTVTRR